MINGNNDSSELPARKRRRKPIKSCAFCRHRKLKCDQKRPVCSSCTSRRLTECIYTDELKHPIDPGHLFSKTPNVELLKKVDELEKQLNLNQNKLNTSENDRMNLDQVLNDNTNTSIQGISPMPGTHSFYSTPSTSISNQIDACPNPLREFCFFQKKPSGRRIMYGATSTRTYVERNTWGFREKYKQLWSKVKIKRDKWKEQHRHFSNKEVGLITQPINHDYNTLLDEVCHDLPTYEKCVCLLNFFFDTNSFELFAISEIIDGKKIIDDFYYHFEREEESLPNGEHKIKKIIPGFKDNYFTSGIIIMIFIMTHYLENIPSSIVKFVFYLKGTSTEKSIYIEHAQFLMMYYHSKRLYDDGYDLGNLISTVDSLTGIAVSLGLDRNIKEIFEGEQGGLGNLECIENLWLWIVLADIEVALLWGRDVRLTYVEFTKDDSDAPFNGNVYAANSNHRNTKRFIELARSMIISINAPTGKPDLKSYSDVLLNFIEVELPPISDFTDLETTNRLAFRDVKLLTVALTLLLALYALRYSVYNERSQHLKNSTIQTCLVSLAIVVTLTKRCHKLDKERYPELFDKGFTSLTPYLSLSSSICMDIFRRALTIFSSLVYYKLTVFESGLVLHPLNDFNILGIKSLRVSNTTDLSIISAFRTYCSIVEGWFKPENAEMTQVMKRSYSLMIILAVEKTYRAILTKVLEYRQLAEKSCGIQIENELDPKKASTISVPDKRGCAVGFFTALPKERKAPPIKEYRTTSVPLTSPSPLQKLLQPLPPPTLTQTDPDHTTEQASETAERQAQNQSIYLQPEMSQSSQLMTGNNIGQPKSASAQVQEADIIQSLTDEFWNSYNNGWEQMLTDSKVDQLFKEF